MLPLSSLTTKPYGLHEMVTKKRPAAFTSYIGGIGSDKSDL
jgi:hypothetical protein